MPEQNNQLYYFTSLSSCCCVFSLSVRMLNTDKINSFKPRLCPEWLLYSCAGWNFKDQFRYWNAAQTHLMTRPVSDSIAQTLTSFRCLRAEAFMLDSAFSWRGSNYLCWWYGYAAAKWNMQGKVDVGHECMRGGKKKSTWLRWISYYHKEDVADFNTLTWFNVLLSWHSVCGVKMLVIALKSRVRQIILHVCEGMQLSAAHPSVDPELKALQSWRNIILMPGRIYWLTTCMQTKSLSILLIFIQSVSKVIFRVNCILLPIGAKTILPQGPLSSCADTFNHIIISIEFANFIFSLFLLKLLNYKTASSHHFSSN